MKKIFAVFFGLLCLFSACLFSACAQAADSTSFNPVLVPVKAKGSGGVPVGTIVAWPSWTNPSDMDNWLECNGQWVNPSVYPELSAIIGANVPDYRGLFLRGVGGNSAGLGVVQTDSGRDVGAQARWVSLWAKWAGSLRADGAVSARWLHNWSDGSDSQDGLYEFTLNLANAWGPEHTSNEFRPMNQAVRYFIRARQ